MPLTESQKEYQRKYYHKNRAKRLQQAKDYASNKKLQKQEYDKGRRIKNMDEIRKKDRDRYYISKKGTISNMLSICKSRAKRKNIPFNLTKEDIIIPEFCPVLGIKLNVNFGVSSSNFDSPSIDRFIPELGYIKGNVFVISNRANAIKNNASIDEIQKLYEWMKIIIDSSHFSYPE